MVALAAFRKDLEKRFPGAKVESPDGCVIEVTAPPGYTWDGDLHQFVAQCRGGLEWARDKKWEADAIAELTKRIDWQPPRPCTDLACEWCHPEDEA